ncbi:hypothetical protein FW781_09805 (plasmid) [Chryseobacterium panacisoli]|uniref:Uncharacterized protein n=1 Tax=Chryseobacterium panacisoli TaxID=1807141 RepID=A0A5D9A038_9FLAO|nr:hypothetical protein [Chryseobacterium panacisoli]TZG00192.1 hypothetical protein FW781_09805 [Chryseobacterium panacisoli]
MKKISISLFFICLFIMIYLKCTFTAYNEEIIKDSSFDNSYYSLEHSLIKSQMKSEKKCDKKHFIWIVREMDYYNYRLNKLVQKSTPFEPGQISKENHTIKTY